MHDADARPIAKGSLGKPVQFGYKGQVTDNDDGIVLYHTLELSNPKTARPPSTGLHSGAPSNGGPAAKAGSAA